MIKADDLEQLAISTGVISTEELERLNERFERAHEEGTCFGRLGGVMVAGEKTVMDASTLSFLALFKH
jgi:hypothetical protein